MQKHCTKYNDNYSIVYWYDNSGNVVGFFYTDKTATAPVTKAYIYTKNTLGDVTGIVGSTGNIVAKYVYDPWGMVIAVTDGNGNDVSATANHIANINPIRYRGYSLDSETGYYYLQSRYYNPKFCRFINADDAEFVGVTDSYSSISAFVYCSNSPILNGDYNGKAPKSGVVLYDPIEFSRQAKDESKYLKGNKKSYKVKMIPIRSKKEFSTAWNNYCGANVEMSLIFHGSPTHLWVNENLLIKDIKNLKYRSLYRLRILSCNSGHKDVPNNVANTFKLKCKCNRIYAMDGSLSFYPRNWYLIGYNYSKYKPRLAFNQSAFKKYASYTWKFAGPNVGYIKTKREQTGFYKIR